MVEPATSSLGLWAITFVVGGLSVVVGWLIKRHFDYAVPSYNRLFGSDDDETREGHLVDSDERFDELDEAHSDLWEEVESLHDDVRKVERRQETSISNQAAIADELGVDLERPRFYDGRGRSSGDD